MVQDKTYTITKEEYEYYEKCKSTGDGYDEYVTSELNQTALQESLRDYQAILQQQTTQTGLLLSEESEYFIRKYGARIYKKLLDQRYRYIEDTTNEYDEFSENTYSMILETINDIYKSKTIDADAFGYLNTYLPSFDANSSYRKIDYTNEESALLSRVNYYINILYYIVFSILILLLASSNRLYFRERFVIYIFLAILPYLFPWMFIITKKLWRYLFPIVDYGGANVVDTNTNTLTMFSNNVSNSFKKGENTSTFNF